MRVAKLAFIPFSSLGDYAITNITVHVHRRHQPYSGSVISRKQHQIIEEYEINTYLSFKNKTNTS